VALLFAHWYHWRSGTDSLSAKALRASAFIEFRHYLFTWIALRDLWLATSFKLAGFNSRFGALLVLDQHAFLAVIAQCCVAICTFVLNASVHAIHDHASTRVLPLFRHLTRAASLLWWTSLLLAKLLLEAGLFGASTADPGALNAMLAFWALLAALVLRRRFWFAAVFDAAAFLLCLDFIAFRGAFVDLFVLFLVTRAPHAFPCGATAVNTLLRHVAAVAASDRFQWIKLEMIAADVHTRPFLAPTFSICLNQERFLPLFTDGFFSGGFATDTAVYSFVAVFSFPSFFTLALIVAGRLRAVAIIFAWILKAVVFRFDLTHKRELVRRAVKIVPFL